MILLILILIFMDSISDLTCPRNSKECCSSSKPSEMLYSLLLPFNSCPYQYHFSNFLYFGFFSVLPSIFISNLEPIFALALIPNFSIFKFLKITSRNLSDMTVLFVIKSISFSQFYKFLFLLKLAYHQPKILFYEHQL